LLHLGVLLVTQHLVRRLHLLTRVAVSVVSLDGFPQRALLAGEAGDLLVVHGHFGPRHLVLDLPIPAGDRLYTAEHYGAAPAHSSPASRALLHAPTATPGKSPDRSPLVHRG